MRRRGSARVAAIVAALVLVAAQGAAGQDWVVLQGSAQAEGWLTDSGSRLLARNGGELAPVGNLYLWGAAEPMRGLQIYTVAELGAGYPDEEQELYHGASFEQLALRWIPSRHLVLDAGRITSPVGAFGPRRLAAQNPVIGVPDLYPLSYPEGVQLSGVARRIDYRAAVVDLPLSNEKYVPSPTKAWRPALGAGITPVAGAHLGVSYTWGPYLNDGLADPIGAGTWRDYDETVLGLDGQLSRGYLELWGELSLSTYQVPGREDTVDGTACYLESRYTFTPRLFIAGRIEMNDYAFIRPPNADGAAWTAMAVKFHDGELGVGYRLGARTLAKASFRKDMWHVTAEQRGFLPDGYAVAVQLSWGFDLLPLDAYGG